MTKREIIKAGRTAIIKNGKSHQEAFDEIKEIEKVERNMLAEELAKIPSSGKLKSTVILRGIFVAALVIIIALRVLSLLAIGLNENINFALVLGILALGIIVPVVGIYGALFARPNNYFPTGILMVVSVFRSMTQGEMTANTETFIVLIPFVVAAFLAFFIPSRLKTPFKKIVSEQFVDGKMVKRMEYVFEDTRLKPSEVLDSQL